MSYLSFEPDMKNLISEIQGLRAAVETIAYPPDAKLANYIHQDLWSAFILSRWPSVPQQTKWTLFQYLPDYLVPGSSGSDPAIIATIAETNIPRSGLDGLPMEWEAVVPSWRVTTTLDVVPPYVLAWASRTIVTLFYNGRLQAEDTLRNLLHGRRLTFGDGRGLRMRAGLEYHAEVSCAPEVLRALYDSMPPGESIMCWVVLEAFVLKAVK